MRAGLLGKDISYSLSPEIHAFLFREMGVTGTYELLDRDKEEIESVLKRGYRGLNVTIPYKEEVMRFLTHPSRDAQKVGAVNTLLMEEGRVTGYNTDVYGAQKMMEHLLPKGGSVTIIGSGGAARAILVAAERMDAGSISVCGRNKEALLKLKRDFPFIGVQKNAHLPGGDLLVNATPCGSARSKEKWAFPKAELTKYRAVADACYAPPLTPLLRAAKKQHLLTESGLKMLIAQAIKAEEIWLGREIPEACYRRLEIHLKTLIEKKEQKK